MSKDLEKTFLEKDPTVRCMKIGGRYYVRDKPYIGKEPTCTVTLDLLFSPFKADVVFTKDELLIYEYNGEENPISWTRMRKELTGELLTTLTEAKKEGLI